ncbi:uncharacterized protein LOC143293467 [Babylonia areolata]|uniref:uncharacterized protein LOC143293467 n=1 Tax=Babylonia areolata TaxID=304850 RepID=UPI003FD0F91C
MARRFIATRVVLIIMCVLCQRVCGQSKESNEASEEGPPVSAVPDEDSLEKTVFSEMLRIVDQKFDSLSARMTVLERSINSLNFYSVRQFREITESIEGSTETTERLRKQVSKLDADDRALKAAVSQVGRDINGIKKNIGVINVGMNDVKADVEVMKVNMKDFRGNSEKMLDDIATSIVYLNENTKQKTEELRGVVEGRAVEGRIDGLSRQLKEDRNRLLRAMEQLEVASSARDSAAPANCTVNFRPLEERLDKKFADMKRQAKNHFLELLNTEEEDTGSDVPSSSSSSSPTGVAQPPSSQKNSAAEIRREAGETSSGEGRGDGEKVMRMLANMTRNVMDAVAYFRHTGGMMERLLATTESVAREQTQLRYDMLDSGLWAPGPDGAFPDDQHVTNASDLLPREGDSEVSPTHPGAAAPDKAASPLAADYAAAAKSRAKARRVYTPAFRQPAHDASSSSPSAHPYPHSLPHPHPLSSEKSLAVLAELAKNGTMLLDVLTDLAQLSSSSLTKAVGSLHQEVVRLEDVRARLNEGLLYPGKASSSFSSSSSSSSSSGPAVAAGPVPGLGGDLGSLQNTTRTIFTIVEAIASNTGWIPYIFHNMQQVERLTNKTLELAKRSLLSVHWNRGMADAALPDSLLQGPGGAHRAKGSPSQAEALDVIYDTNVQLRRILPALTRLVAEPEPLIALAEGSSFREGRVEVFHRGQWGAVCADSMGHEEADALCRHLGHAGGIWAGELPSERGQAVRYRQLNATCLDSPQLCSFLSNSSSVVECLTGQFAVICDHMLRLTPIPELQEEDDRTPDTGLLSLHHQGQWLPICGQGWSGYEARVACQQLGFRDGREVEEGEVGEWRHLLGNVTAWVSGVSCKGEELRLDACTVDSFRAKACSDDAAPAAVRCQ